mmetsp:Transcript_23140/g.74060  ORF Transcript_23140/g.74060 Transcript_23140/m.74060 type:complete len:224 (+) Transcript_23140:396-1067(+)
MMRRGVSGCVAGAASVTGVPKQQPLPTAKQPHEWAGARRRVRTRRGTVAPQEEGGTDLSAAPLPRLLQLPRAPSRRLRLAATSAHISLPTTRSGVQVARNLADRLQRLPQRAEVGAGVVPGSVSPPRGGGGAAEFVAGSSTSASRRARSALAAEVLINAGFTEVKSVEGGTWVAAGCQSSNAFAADRKLVWDFPRRARSPIVGTLERLSERLASLCTVLAAWG